MTYIIPCAITKNDLFSVCMEHITTCNYVPNDIFKASRFDFMLYYVPTYVFSGKYQANWSASFGYDRTHEYTQYTKITDYDAYSGRSYERRVPEKRTKTITNWVPVSGVDQGDYWVQVYAGIGVDTNAVPFITNTSLAPQSMKLTSHYADGLPMDVYSITEDEAYTTKASSVVENIITRNVKRWAQGDSQRDWFWTTQYHKAPTIKVMMPIGKCSIAYQGRDYRIWVDGKDKTRLTGNLPVDWNKKINVYVGLMPLFLIVSGWFTHISLPDFDAWLNTQLASMGIRLNDGFIQSLVVDFSDNNRFWLLMAIALCFYFARKWFLIKRSNDVLKHLLQEYMANMKNGTKLSRKVHTYGFLDISLVLMVGFSCAILALPVKLLYFIESPIYNAAAIMDFVKSVITLIIMFGSGPFLFILFYKRLSDAQVISRFNKSIGITRIGLAFILRTRGYAYSSVIGFHKK